MVRAACLTAFLLAGTLQADTPPSLADLVRNWAIQNSQCASQRASIGFTRHHFENFLLTSQKPFPLDANHCTINQQGNG